MPPAAAAVAQEHVGLVILIIADLAGLVLVWVRQLGVDDAVDVRQVAGCQLGRMDAVGVATTSHNDDYARWAHLDHPVDGLSCRYLQGVGVVGVP